jgi:hypothetical protein
MKYFAVVKVCKEPTTWRESRTWIEEKEHYFDTELKRKNFIKEQAQRNISAGSKLVTYEVDDEERIMIPGTWKMNKFCEWNDIAE